MSNDTLIQQLSSGLEPVRRRRMSREVAMLAMLGALELAMLAAAGLLRPDMGRIVGSAYMIWKLGGLAALAVVSIWTALHSFSPTSRSRGALAPAFAVAAPVMLLGITGLWGIAGLGDNSGRSSDAGAALIDRLAPAHGLVCTSAIVALSLPIMAALGWMMRRAAPAAPRSSAVTCGLAAGMLGALIFAFCCRENDPLYVVFWYLTACGIVVAMSRWLLPRHFRL